MDWIQIFGLITGLICVYLIVRENDWNWSIGIINSILLLIVFWKTSLYAQVGLQALYIIEGGFGWWQWMQKNKETGEKVVKINMSRPWQYAIFSVIGIVGTLVLWKIFVKTSDPAPFIDSLITVASIVAELMLCWKLMESWVIYLLTDLVSIWLYFSTGLYLTGLTYIGFTFLCALGIIRWRKIYKENKNKKEISV